MIIASHWWCIVVVSKASMLQHSWRWSCHVAALRRMKLPQCGTQADEDAMLLHCGRWSCHVGAFYFGRWSCNVVANGGWSCQVAALWQMKLPCCGTLADEAAMYRLSSWSCHLVATLVFEISPLHCDKLSTALDCIDHRAMWLLSG